jgi:mannose-6-phosphate isomerase-like protein (cupin superfamily)
MKLSLKNSSRRQVDDALVIQDLFDGSGFPFDFVVAELNGNHPTVRNKISDRVYFFLDGTASVKVAAQRFEVEKYDLITIPKNTPHSLSGHARYIVITSPPFDPANEIVEVRDENDHHT